ncbi:hypothetical protein EGH21_22265 [Halomicroarcula sp. F13]|uniref:Uncharacterized protein n=1 Tax=Haloarcula rubra TaxID=2487747 RepID=A0AAW4PYY3_9EURY|nr:hypothetical protein [Halomicroarcula rubra]MBX0325745.1 hypothetical protein [Halomicroarcula rubra]
MSTSRPTSTGSTGQRPSNRGDRALRLFDDLLFEHPEYCSTCFSRIRDRTEHDQSADSLGTGNKPTETLERSGKGIIGQDATDHDDYGAQRSHHARTYCGECGSPSGRASGARICSLQEAISRSHNIARALHRHGYYPDIDTLYRAVERLKTDPERQGKDREIFATATYLAVAAGDEAPDVPAKVPRGKLEPIRDQLGVQTGVREVEWTPAQKPRWLRILEDLDG